jgi:CHAT domain-containing protein
MQSKENTYRITASQLIFSGRLCEAQQVLDILKDEEYFSFVLQNRSAYIPQYAPIDYTGFESKWINRQNTIVKKISSISSPYNELLIKPNKTPKEEKKLESLKVELEKAQKEYRDFLDQLKKEFETYKYKEDPDIDAITTPTSQTVKQSPPFDDKEFNAMIYAYRDLIEKLARLSRIANPPATAASKIAELSRQKRDIENKLYNLIFKPVHQYLKQYGAFNLLVSLDGVLRYIPLTSLWDGEHYLVQQYRFVLLTPSILKQMDEKPVIENKILGMGASKGGKGFKPLPHAGQEIRAIVNDREKGCTGLIKGNALIDNDFTRRNHDQQA